MKKINQNIVNLSSMTPLTMRQAADIIGMVKIPKGRTFIITNEELSHNPRETFFKRAKEGIKQGNIK